MNWAKNPYGLEEARVKPKGEETFSNFVPEPNSKNILLLQHYEKNSFAIYLPVPNHYIHSSNYTSRVKKAYGYPVYMYYPGLNGKFHPSNKNLPKCKGYCNGYISTSMKASSISAVSQNKNKLERIKADREKQNSLHNYSDLRGIHGLNNRIEISYPMIENKNGGKKHQTKEYLYSLDDVGEVKYFFECRPYTPSPSCNTKFNHSAIPELIIDIRFAQDLMPEWRNIIQSIDMKISSWGPQKLEVLSNRYHD